MKYAIIITRVLLGLVFAVFGSNAFLHFIPMQEIPGEAGAFMGALFNSNYVYAIAAVCSSSSAGALFRLVSRCLAR